MTEGTGYKPGGRSGMAPDPLWWMAEIRKGVEDRNKKAHRAKWEMWRKWYRGHYAAKAVPVNVFFKMLRTMVPRVYFRNPSVTISPRKHQQGQLDYWLFSQLLEQVDNALFDRMRLKASMKKGVQDGFLFGTGILKLGYGGVYNPTPAPAQTSEAPTDKHDQRLEYNSFILPDMPWVMRLPTSRFIVPAHTLDWQSSRWAAHEERRHIDDVRDDPRFKHVKDIQPGVLMTAGEEGINKISDQVSMVEIRDKKSGEVFVLAPSQKDKVLAREEDELQFDARLPYFPIQFNADDDQFWGVPDSQILEPHQIEINDIRRVVKMHRKISVLKYLVRKGAVSADEIAKLTNPDEVGTVINVEKDVAMFEQVIKEMQAGDIPAGLLKADQLEEQIIQEVLGLGVNQFGEYAPGSADRSATEAMIVNQAVQIRTDERRDIIADVVVDLTEHLNHVILEHWDRDQVVSVIGPGGETIWTQFKMSETKSLEYDVKVDMDSSVPETKQVRRQFAQQIYGAFVQNPFIDVQKLTKWALGEMGGPQLVDLMKGGGSPQPQQPIVQPGGPGSNPQNPLPSHEVIRRLADRSKLAGGGGQVA